MHAWANGGAGSLFQPRDAFGWCGAPDRFGFASR